MPEFNVHVTFSGHEQADAALGVATAIQKAGGEMTGMMAGQVSDWFVVWRQGLHKAAYVIVFFSHAYRSNFTPALQLEAAAIIALHRQGQINVYVFDPLRGRPAVQPAGRRDHDGSHERLDAIFAVAFIDRRRG